MDMYKREEDADRTSFVAPRYTFYPRVMTNTLNLICYFLVLSATLSTEAVVHDIFDGHNDIVTRPAVPDGMVVRWRSDDLKLSSDHILEDGHGTLFRILQAGRRDFQVFLVAL